MATDDRLARLGLLHLKHKPEELDTELKRRVAAYQAEVDAWNRERSIPPPEGSAAQVPENSENPHAADKQLEHPTRSRASKSGVSSGAAPVRPLGQGVKQDPFIKTGNLPPMTKRSGNLPGTPSKK